MMADGVPRYPWFKNAILTGIDVQGFIPLAKTPQLGIIRGSNIMGDSI